MTYALPFIYSINPVTCSLIEHAHNCSGACNYGPDCLNGAYDVDE